MHLASYNSATRRLDVLRDLTGEEIAQNAKFAPLIGEARARLSLFRILDRNYSEWKAYLNRLLSATFKEDVDVSEELNRLLLNYLTVAYTIQAHFSVSFSVSASRSILPFSRNIRTS